MRISIRQELSRGARIGPGRIRLPSRLFAGRAVSSSMRDTAIERGEYRVFQPASGIPHALQGHPKVDPRCGFAHFVINSSL